MTDGPTLPNETWEDVAFDAGSRSTSITLKKTGVNMRTQSYAYDVASNVTSHTVDSLATSYTYDNINQLTAEARTGYSAYYTYDANGNRASRLLNGVPETYTNDDGDKLTSVSWTGGGSKTFTYDGAGRRKTMTTGGVTTTYNWDYESRITSISKPGMTTNTFGYNGLDARVSKVDSGGTKTFRRNGAGVTSPVLADSSANYTPGISERRGSTSTFLHSGIKNADSQTSASPTISATRQYDAFGNVTTSTGSFQGPFGYAGGLGYQEDADTGVKLLGYRYYDSETGRFLSRDSENEGRNWYSYCESNPMSRCDPAGLDWILYDGQYMMYYAGKPGDTSKLLVRCGATSGLCPTPEDPTDYRQKKYVRHKDGGPAPEGEYTISLAPDTHRVASQVETADGTMLSPSSKGGIEQIPPDYPNWGTWRGRLDHKSGDMHGRDGVYIHDSGKGFLHGCVEVSHKDGQVILGKLRKYKQKRESKDYRSCEICLAKHSWPI